jgi:predicted transglutaminase-like protease
MVKCNFCGAEEALYFVCKFCGKNYCTQHRLPPSHNCTGIEQWKAKESLSTLKDKYLEREKSMRVDLSDYRKYRRSKKRKKSTKYVAVTAFVIFLLAVMYEGYLFRETIFPSLRPSLQGGLNQTGTLQQTLTTLTNTQTSTTSPSYKTISPTTTRYATSIDSTGFRLTQNATHLIIEDYGSELVPFYSITLKDGTRLFQLVPYETRNAVIAEYAYISRGYAKEIYNLKEIFERLPQEYTSTFKLEIFTHNKIYDFIADRESQRILFSGYSDVLYLSSSSASNTVYDVVFRSFNETTFYRINKLVFDKYSERPLLFKVWHLVEWVDSNTVYDYTKKESANRYIYDPVTFVERKSGVCSDYAIFYASALLALGSKDSYVLTFDTITGEGHAVAALEYNGVLLILEQHLPIMEFEDYVQYDEDIVNTSIPFYSYRIVNSGGEFAIEFFKPDLRKYEDSTPLDGITDRFAKDVEESLSCKLKASITDKVLPYSWKWSWSVLRFYATLLHDQWVECVSNILAKEFIDARISPRYISIDEIDSTTLLIRFES